MAAEQGRTKQGMCCAAGTDVEAVCVCVCRRAAERVLGRTCTKGLRCAGRRQEGGQSSGARKQRVPAGHR